MLNIKYLSLINGALYSNSKLTLDFDMNGRMQILDNNHAIFELKISDWNNSITKGNLSISLVSTESAPSSNEEVCLRISMVTVKQTILHMEYLFNYANWIR